MTSWEGEEVTGAIFPKGAGRWPCLSRWACWSASWRLVGLCLAIVECHLLGGKWSEGVGQDGKPNSSSGALDAS